MKAENGWTSLLWTAHGGRTIATTNLNFILTPSYDSSFILNIELHHGYLNKEIVYHGLVNKSLTSFILKHVMLSLKETMLFSCLLIKARCASFAVHSK